MKQFAAELVLDAKAELGEGPVWNERRQALWFVDITGRAIHEWSPVQGTVRSRSTPEPVGCVAPSRSGRIIAALASGIWAIGEADGALELLQRPPTHDPSRCRFNDGKCDPRGRFLAGTMSLTGEAEAGALYGFEAGRPPRVVMPLVTASNGLAWSLDGTELHYIDSRTRRVDTFFYDLESGVISNRRPTIDFTPTGHIPDGCTLDAEGMLWVAHWRGGCVTRWEPSTGRCLATVSVPAPHVSSCTFGGPGLETLFITTARAGLTPEQLTSYPASGGVFACRPGVPGLAAQLFND